jgi:hypothetical protein
MEIVKLLPALVFAVVKYGGIFGMFTKRAAKLYITQVLFK